MTVGIYCVRDLRSNFNQPFTELNDQVAVRGFGFSINESAMAAANAGDYQLYRLGDFDPDNGRISVYDLPVLIMSGNECVHDR